MIATISFFRHRAMMLIWAFLLVLTLLRTQRLPEEHPTAQRQELMLLQLARSSQDRDTRVPFLPNRCFLQSSFPTHTRTIRFPGTKRHYGATRAVFFFPGGLPRTQPPPQRRSRGNQDPGDLYAYVYVHLEEGPAARLDTAYTALANLWNRGVPENDVSWLATVGTFQDPPKHVCLQHLDRMLRSCLTRHLDADSADHMADYMVDYVRSLDLFYVPTLLALFPLLDDDGRREFQQWFQDYRNRRLDMPSSSSRGPAA